MKEEEGNQGKVTLSTGEMWSPTWKGRELEPGGTEAEAPPQGHPVVTVWLKVHYEENAFTMQCYLRNFKKYCENSLHSQKLLLIFSSKFPPTMPVVLATSRQNRETRVKNLWVMGKCVPDVWCYCLVLGDQGVLVSQPWPHFHSVGDFKHIAYCDFQNPPHHWRKESWRN